MKKGRYRFVHLLSLIWVLYSVIYSDLGELIVSCFIAITIQIMMTQSKEK